MKKLINLVNKLRLIKEHSKVSNGNTKDLDNILKKYKNDF